MKTTIKLIILSLLIFSTDTWAQQSAGFLKNLSGDVTIQRGESIIAADQGLQLMNNDILLTGAKGSAGIIFTDGTTITIGPDSEFNIKNYQFKPDTETYAFSMYLNKGSAIYSSGKIGKLSPKSVDIATPRASVGVRGTRFIIEVE